MKYSELYKNVIKLCGIREGDINADNSIKLSINKAYVTDLSKLDKRISTSYLPSINGVVNLPDDLLEIIKVTPALDSTDRIIGNSILTDKTDTFSIVYSIVREPLIDDNDEPDLSNSLIYALILHGAYGYFVHKKDTDTASMLLAQYNDIKNSYSMKDNYIEEQVADVY